MREITGFQRPFAVQMNSLGEIFVADFIGHKVKMFNCNFELIKELGPHFSGPHSIALDQDENIWINDYCAQKVLKFSRTGEFIGIPIDRAKYSGFIMSGPAQAQFDPDWNLIVSDYGSCSLQKFAQDGAFLGWFGKSSDGECVRWGMGGTPISSTGSGGFDRVHSVAFDKDRNMYVVDTWNDRVQVFTKDGYFIEEFPFQSPASIDLEGDHFVVSENRTGSVQCCSLNGIQKWSRGGFNHPYDVKIKGKTLLVADADNKRIYIEEI